MGNNAGVIMSEEILFVDHEPGVLGGSRRLLHKDFSVDVAVAAGEGLALAHAAIVHRYKEQLRFEAQPVQGTTFFIRLPLEASPAVS
jgi:signal transduction histidine kinase